MPQVRSEADAVTKHTCADQGSWLGNSSYPKFTVIDTPGFGENIMYVMTQSSCHHHQK